MKADGHSGSGLSLSEYLQHACNTSQFIFDPSNATRVNAYPLSSFCRCTRSHRPSPHCLGCHVGVGGQRRSRPLFLLGFEQKRAVLLFGHHIKVAATNRQFKGALSHRVGLRWPPLPAGGKLLTRDASSPPKAGQHRQAAGSPGGGARHDRPPLVLGAWNYSLEVNPRHA